MRKRAKKESGKSELRVAALKGRNMKAQGRASPRATLWVKLHQNSLARIFHSEVAQSHANPCSAGFQVCRIAGFQTCVPCLFNDAFELVDTPLFMGVFTSLSKWL